MNEMQRAYATIALQNKALNRVAFLAKQIENEAKGLNPCAGVRRVIAKRITAALTEPADHESPSDIQNDLLTRKRNKDGPYPV